MAVYETIWYFEPKHDLLLTLTKVGFVPQLNHTMSTALSRRAVSACSRAVRTIREVFQTGNIHVKALESEQQLKKSELHHVKLKQGGQK